jgi:hypothetical protein
MIRKKTCLDSNLASGARFDIPSTVFRFRARWTLKAVGLGKAKQLPYFCGMFFAQMGTSWNDQGDLSRSSSETKVDFFAHHPNLSRPAPPQKGPWPNLVGGVEHEFHFSIWLGISSSQLTNSIIFQRGRRTNHQPVIIDKPYYSRSATI